MTARLACGLLLALASAGALNWSYFAQHGAAGKLPPLSVRHPVRSLRSLFMNARWLVGFFVGIAGWALYVGALALAPLSLVQAASAGGVGLLALLVWRTTGVRLARGEWAGVGCAVAGLALLGGSLAGHRPGGSHGSWLGAATWIGVSLVAAGLVASAGARVLAPGAGLGLAAGILYAAGDVGTKAAVVGGGRLLFVPVFLACHGLAFVALQTAFQRGSALATAGVATLVTNALPIAAGIALFREVVPGGGLGVLRVASFCAVIAGAALLARSLGPQVHDVVTELGGKTLGDEGAVAGLGITLDAHER